MGRINYLTFILATAILMVVMFFGELYRSYPPFLALTVISFLISLVNLFLIHHKTLQIRLCVYNAIILVAYQVWIIYLLWSIKKHSGLALEKFPVSIVFPSICIILNILAISHLRRITASENLLTKLKANKKKNTKK